MSMAKLRGLQASLMQIWYTCGSELLQLSRPVKALPMTRLTMCVTGFLSGRFMVGLVHLPGVCLIQLRSSLLYALFVLLFLYKHC